MEEFEVTIAYKAVITVNVKANSKEEAEQKGLNNFKEKERRKWFYRNDVNLQDDTFSVQGVVNMSRSWNEL